MTVPCPPPPDYHLQAVYIGSDWAADKKPVRRALRGANDLFHASSLRLGGDQDLVWARYPKCGVSVHVENVDGPWRLEWYAGPIPGWNPDPHIKYVVFTDEVGMGACGYGMVWADDQPGQGNLNNGVLNGNAVVPRCGWNGETVLHEVMHVLGAVQQGVGGDKFGHCTIIGDPMCDTSAPTGTCPGFFKPWFDHRLLDCTGDQYYNPAPKAGGYLVSHWNVALSRFVEGV